MAGNIKRLEEHVVNRIAAGEVIHRPSNALKELMENCLDAKASKISVSLKAGGMKVLQVQDNGCGIRKEDYGILCERFTTSKLTSFDDLSSIATFGFRGEALASVTHVAHVTITSMTKDQPCAYKARYSDGALVPLTPGGKAEPKACAGVKGTTILAEDLFFNVPVRKQALKSASDEYNRCLDVVTRYAIHNSGVGFTCKKIGEAHSDINTSPSASKIDNIRSLFGQSVSRELLPLKATSDAINVTLDGYVTNANFSVKKFTFILFINHRLVECNTIKKAIDNIFSEYLPKRSHPFVYLSVMMRPEQLDVNVHPTKKEVHFLNEEEIVAFIEQELEKVLQGANQSRTFYSQGLLPGASEPPPSSPPRRGSGGNRWRKKKGPLALTDEGFGLKASSSSSSSSSSEESKEEGSSGDGEKKSITKSDSAPKTLYRPEKMVRTDSLNPAGRLEGWLRHPTKRSLSNPSLLQESRKRMRHRPVTLTSVKNLQGEIDSDCHNELKDVIGHHTFVGCVDEQYALAQHKTKLYLFNVARLSKAYFYEQTIRQFKNFARIKLSSPAPIKKLVLLALETVEAEWNPEDGDKPSIAKFVEETLMSKATMLRDYFAVDINEDGELECLPEILAHYTPPLAALPLFLLRLGLDVDWSSEEACFKTIAEEISSFYRIQPGLYLPQQTLTEDEKEPGVQWLIQHVLFPAFRVSFSPPRRFATDGSVTQVANLENLYKIFERC